MLGEGAAGPRSCVGEGACQALEDPAVLAHCLGETSPIEAALRRYEDLRLPRATGRRGR